MNVGKSENQLAKRASESAKGRCTRALESKKKLNVIMDSSFLFVPAQFNIDIFGELEKTLNRRFEPIILSLTYKELLKKAESKSTKQRKQATIALKFAQGCRRFNVEESPREPHDDALVRVAHQMKWAVATNDRILRRKLRNLNLPVIYLRQKTRLAVEGAI